jgi:prevent-host-death family protein
MGRNPVMAVTCRGKPVLVLVKAEEWDELVSLVKELRAVTAEP